MAWELIEGYLLDVQRLVLLFAVGLLALFVASSIFKLDSRARTRRALIAEEDPEVQVEFLYMSHFAEDARRRLLRMVTFIKYSFLLLIILLSLSFTADSFVFCALSETFWKQWLYGKQLLHGVFIFLLIATAVLMVYWFIEIIVDVFQAKESYQDKKDYYAR